MGASESAHRTSGSRRAGSVWFGVLMRNARRREFAKCAKLNGDPGAIRSRDPQLRRLIGKSHNLLILQCFRTAPPILPIAFHL